MIRPELTGLNPEITAYITSLEVDSLQNKIELARRDERITQMDLRIKDLEQMLQNLQRLYFGKKSEKIQQPMDGAEQLSFLFGDKEPVSDSLQENEEDDAVEVSSFKRKKKRTQEEIIASLPVIIHEYKLADEDIRCPRCGEEDLECIGKELVYSEYERVPAHVDRHDYYAYKYACHNCEDGTGACETCKNSGTDKCKHCIERLRLIVIQAQIPKELITPLIKGSKASASIMAQIYDDKFEQGIPLYRQEKEWERLGFPLTRQTMTNWALRIDKDYFQPVVSYMKKKAIAESSVIHSDETHIKVIQQKTESGSLKKCQMWVIRTGFCEPIPIVVFNYRPSRAGKEPIDILAGYDRYFVSDGYSGYNLLGKNATRCGCWAHLRRKFFDSVPNHDMSKPGSAREGVRWCDKLFRIEEKLEKVTPEERQRIRNTESRKVIEDFYEWLGTVDPAHKNMKDAISFATRQKEYLMRFLDDGRIPITNSVAENAIRPFVVGRKNWLFSNSDDGATATANAYSIVETAKANNVDVHKYLDYILKKLPVAAGNLTEDFLESIMPWNATVQETCKRGNI